MAEAIKLKSKAVSIYDYHQVDISRFITGFSVDGKILTASCADSAAGRAFHR